MNRTDYNVLVINGGGIKGLKPLIMLTALEERLGGNLLNYFDLISGTSTGGIIAACLAKGMKAKDIMDLYLVHGSKIFKKRFMYKLRKPMFDDKYVNSVLEEYFSEIAFRDLLCDVLIPSYNMQTRDFVFFKRTNFTQNFRVFDGVRATMSAQVYFKPHNINGMPYVDGGNGLNNPAGVALKEARTKANGKKINILNFGTGKLEKPLDPNMGKIKWLLNMPNILMTEAEQLVVSSLQYEFDPTLPSKASDLGTYLFCDSVIQYSSEDMEDASPKNLEALIKDGHLSYQMNTIALTEFITLIKK